MNPGMVFCSGERSLLREGDFVIGDEVVFEFDLSVRLRFDLKPTPQGVRLFGLLYVVNNSASRRYYAVYVALFDKGKTLLSADRYRSMTAVKPGSVDSTSLIFDIEPLELENIRHFAVRYKEYSDVDSKK